MSAFTRRAATPPRPLMPESLGVAITEHIQDWFAVHARGVADQNQILAALGACLADQIVQNPNERIQDAIAERTFACIRQAVAGENARRRADEPTIEKH